MSTLKELLKQHGHSAAAEIEWLHMLVAEWQLIADLSMGDLVLWVRNPQGEYIAVASARPASALPILYRDITGEVVPEQWLAGLEHARDTGLIFFSPKTTFDSINTRLEVVPVRRVASTTDQHEVAEPIAFLSRHTQLDYVQTPNKISINYVKAANDLLEMVAHGMYPDFSTPTASRRGAPRANDGVLRLDEDGKVLFASPNAVSALNRFGASGAIEGQSLSASVTPALKLGSVDESLPLVLTGRAAWRTDIEAKTVTLSIRAIPIRHGNKRTGAIVLIRDVTELRRQEQELITKDATIREIHHRVKNNLQTVASLLRIQSRRSKNDEVRETLDQAMRRVSAIALVHDTLSEGTAQELNFDEVFDRVLLLTAEVATIHNTNVNTIIDGKFGQLPGSIATPLAVALTEIVANAVEHGLGERSGAVHVNAERKPKKLEITVSDNGRGIEGGKLGDGLGTQIILTLIEGELRGTINWFSPPDGGTKVSISIPL